MATNPPHRPTVYQDDYCEAVTEWLSEGKTLASFAKHVGVNSVTIWRWHETIPEFCNAIKSGREIANKIYSEQFLLDNLEKQSLNNVMAILYCRNVLKIETKDKADNSATDKLADALKSVVTTYALPDNGRHNVDKTTA